MMENVRAFMLVILTITTIILTMSSATFAQDIWEIMCRMDWETNFRDVCFADTDDGWAVGSGGIIAHTINGGIVWEQQNSQTRNNLFGIHFADSQEGWAVGGRGTILHTEDAGETWDRQDALTDALLLAVHFINSDEGWAVGEYLTIIHTSDGGDTWDLQYEGSDVDPPLIDVYFSDSNIGWAVGAWGLIYHTTDGGDTWEQQTSGQEGTGNWLWSAHFVDSNTGWVAGDGGTILKTTNGGDTWTPQNSGTDRWLEGVFFTDALNGWAVGESGTVLHTPDGGATWNPQVSTISNSLCGICFADADTGWAVGNAGAIISTADGGDTWGTQTLAESHSLYGLDFGTSQDGWAVGSHGMVLHTPDGGETWTEQESGTQDALLAVDFVNSTHGWAVGSYGTILHTGDGGDIWTVQESGTGNLLLGVCFVDSSSGWAVGGSFLEGTILHTDDGGDTWIPQESPTADALWGVQFVSQDEGWAVGETGVILHTSNGGDVWMLQDSGVYELLAGVYFANSDDGWAAGDRGTILHTGDGGETWEGQESGVFTWLEAARFINPTQGWVVGDGGVILHTDDGGANWAVQETGVQSNLNDIDSLDTATSAVGDWGLILSIIAGERVIQLREGWNIISLPLDNGEYDLHSVLGSAENQCKSVWAYDTSIAGWRYHIIGYPDYLNTLNTMEPGRGYCIDMINAANLVISGQEIANTAIQFHEGWNLVGYNSLEQRPVEEALASISGNCRSVWAYDAIEDDWEVCVLIGPRFLSNLEVMEPKKGYWMDMLNGCVWDVNATTQQAAPPLIARSVEGRASGDRPEIPYIIWGSVEANGVRLAGGSAEPYAPVIMLRVDGKTVSRYSLGTSGSYEDYYALDVPSDVDDPARVELYVQIGDDLVKAAPVPPGEPGQIIRFDLSVRISPEASMLYQNYPNPFNPDTWIPYQLREDADVVIRIYASTGQLVRTLDLGYKPSGFYIENEKAAHWDGMNEVGEKVASGIYFYSITAGDFSDIKKMTVRR